MKEILFMTAKDSAPGFALTGVRQQSLDPEQALEKLQDAFAEPAVGVIVVDNRLLAKVAPVRWRDLAERWPGVLVTLPAPAGRRTPPVDELQRLVQRALGYHVRLQS